MCRCAPPPEPEPETTAATPECPNFMCAMFCEHGFMKDPETGKSLTHCKSDQEKNDTCGDHNFIS